MEFEIYRRSRKTMGRWRDKSKLYIKLTLPRGTIEIFKNTMKAIGVNYNDAIMFGFNKDEKKGIIFKEEPKDDSYYLQQNHSKNHDYSGRFTSKDLGIVMREIFGFDISVSKVYFEVNKTPNEKGQFEFELVCCM